MRLLFILLLISVAVHAQEFSKVEEDLQGSFLSAKTGDTIYIPKGEYKILRTLWLADANNVVILGAGMDESILDFSGQIDGAEGIKVTNSRDITLKGFTVREAKGDGVKVQDTENITISEVRAEWVGKPDARNGAYGIYPVLSKGIIVQNSEAIGASDAGIYVGQSESIIVKNNRVYNNVAGIEIENSRHADVFNNNASGNTGGILVFDLPDLQVKKGGHIRVFDNIVAENNLKNFAPKGNIVAKVPLGTGVLILASTDVEVFNNKILDNRSVGLGIISYHMAELPITDESYDPLPQRVTIHDNQFIRKNIRATGKGRMGKMFRYKLKFGKDVPHILWDGITEGADLGICISNNDEESFANMDAANDFKSISRDLGQLGCKGDRLEKVIIDP